MKHITSIEKFNFKLGGYFSSIHEVRIKRDTVTYIVKEFPCDIGFKNKKEVSAASLECFKSKLNKLNFVTWQKEYFNPVMDGEEWEINTTFNGSIRKKIVGLNGYPGDNSNFIGRTEIFNELLLALNDLIQEPDFFS